MRNRTGEEEQKTFCFNAGRTAACSLIHQTKLSVHSVTDLGQNTIQDAFYLPGREVHLSRLSGLNKADH